jgi:hypothetical protein
MVFRRQYGCEKEGKEHQAFARREEIGSPEVAQSQPLTDFYFKANW